MIKINALSVSLSRHVLPLALLLASAAGSAQAAPVLTFSNIKESATNVAITTSLPTFVSGKATTPAQNTYFPDVEVVRSVVQIAPTKTTTGLAIDYLDTTHSYTTDYSNYQYDYLNTRVSADSTAFSDDKYIVISGTVKATRNSQLSINMDANGSYQTTSNIFGPKKPTLPSFYFGSSLSSLDLVATTTTSGSNTYTQDGHALLSLTANVSTNFYAVVLAEDKASLASFSLGLITEYDFVPNSVVTTYTTTKITGAHVLAVPEADTYAMLLAGLGMIGVISRRRNKQALQA